MTEGFDPRIGLAYRTRIADALRRGATRRDVVGKLTASGMAAAIAGTILGSA